MHIALPRMDLELVSLAGANFRNEQLPDARRTDQPHRVQATVPGVEVANHRHGARGRRPDRERGPRGPAMVGRMRAEAFPDALMAPFRGKMAVPLAERGREAVRVAHREAVPVGILDLDEIAENIGAVVETRLEDTAAAMRGG